MFHGYIHTGPFEGFIMTLKFVKAQKSGEYVLIKEGDMDFNTPFASTLKEMKEEKARIDRALSMFVTTLKEDNNDRVFQP
jgi:hypothetical protein